MINKIISKLLLSMCVLTVYGNIPEELYNNIKHNIQTNHVLSKCISNVTIQSYDNICNDLVENICTDNSVIYTISNTVHTFVHNLNSTDKERYLESVTKMFPGKPLNMTYIISATCGSLKHITGGVYILLHTCHKFINTGTIVGQCAIKLIIDTFNLVFPTY